jgi:hypothetical protein
MRIRRWLVALVPLALIVGSLRAQDRDDKFIDALISIDSDCAPSAVTPSRVYAERGSKIRWGVTSECGDGTTEVTVSIEMKGADPLEECERSTKKKKHKPAKPITCKVKSDAAFTVYEYSVSVGEETLDPEIEVYT